MRGLVLLVPMAAGFGAAVLVSQAFGEPHGAFEVALFWASVIGASIVAVLLVDSQCRRLLPLAALLRLSLVFPDRAPSRFRVALRAGSVRRLERMAHETTGKEAPSEAAQRILVLTGALARHDAATRGHSERVRAYTDLLAEELGLTEAQTDRLRWSALLHDVGKLAVRHDVLNKREPLDDSEWEALRRHPEEGARMAKPLRKWLGPWALAIAQHHEHWDGTGYPRGLAGKKIARGARIVAVADAYDVMTATRSYKSAVRADAARTELAECSGRHFDPEVVRAFLDISLGRIRWVLGFGAMFAIPFLPGAAGRAARTAGIGGAAAAVALVLGITPLAAPSVAKTEVLGEHFERPPAAASGPADAPPSAPDPTPPTAAPPIVTPINGGTVSTTDSTVVALPAATPPVVTGAAAIGPTPSVVPPGGPPSSTTTTTTVIPPIEPPRVAVDDIVTTVARKAIHIAVLANDSEPGGTLVPGSVSIVVPPQHGTAHPHKDGRLHYKPDAGYLGTDSLSYSVCDTAGQCFVATVTLTILPR